MIKTKRLILTHWKDSDLEPFAKLNSDPRVMEYFPKKLSKEESDKMAKNMEEKIKENGFGFWAVSLIETGKFIGMIGLNNVSFSAHFTPAIEIGWRIGFDYWSCGYATEGAKAALDFGFDVLKFKEIVSFTTINNTRSIAVMERIGMHHDYKDDFDHPKSCQTATL